MEDSELEEEEKNLLTECYNTSQFQINIQNDIETERTPIQDTSQTVENQKVEYRSMAIQTILSDRQFEKMYEPQPNIYYLLGFTLTLALSSCQMGLIGAQNMPVSKALRFQQNWGSDKAIIDFDVTLMSTCAVAGIALGSVFGGDFVKTGRRSTIIYFNAIGFVGTLISFLPNFIVMCIGRVIVGFTCGVLICATPKAIDETIPSKLIDKGFGTSTNIVINLAFMAVMLLSLGLPEEETSLQNSYYWMIIFGIQMPLQLLAIILHLTIFTEETIDFNVKQGNKDDALKTIAQIYSEESSQVHQQIYDQKQEYFDRKAQENELSGNQDSIWHAIMDPSQRQGTWTCIIIALFNNFSGQGLICMYSTAIFEDVTIMGSKSRFDIKTENNFLGYAAVLGAILSYYSVSFFKRKTLFVGGHFIMGALLLMSGYYIHTMKHDLCLLCICIYIIVFQMSIGSMFFIYVSEVVSSDSVMGLCIFTIQFCMTLQSMTTVWLLNSKLGVDGMFYVLGIIQVFAFVTLGIIVKESKGLTDVEKKNLYGIKEKKTI